MRAKLHHVDSISEVIKTFWFETEQPIQWTPGQFTELTLDHPDVDDRGTKRWFTISSAPSDGMPAITTRLIGDKGSSFKRALAALQPGQELDFAEPMGDFVLPKDASRPLYFVAGGIGITPYHSMFRQLAASGEKRDIRFIWAVRSEDDLIFQDDIKAAGINSTFVVSEPSDGWQGVRGRADAETILGVEKPSDSSLIFLSGPEPMLEALQDDLINHGVNKSQIVNDFFPGYNSL